MSESPKDMAPLFNLEILVCDVLRGASPDKTRATLSAEVVAALLEKGVNDLRKVLEGESQ